MGKADCDSKYGVHLNTNEYKFNKDPTWVSQMHYGVG